MSCWTINGQQTNAADKRYNNNHRQGLQQSPPRFWWMMLVLASSCVVITTAETQQLLGAGHQSYTGKEAGRNRIETTSGVGSGRDANPLWSNPSTSRLPDVVVRNQPEVTSSSTNWHPTRLLQREERQVPTSPAQTEATSSSQIVHGDIGSMLLDATFPLTGFDDVDFDDSGIGPISLGGGHLDSLEMHRRRSSTTTTMSTVPDDDSESAFSGALETNVTASLGQTAFLRCRLKNAQHQVTWIRIRDWHILTSGLLTYTADARFRVKYATEVSEWTLEIKFLQKRDEGTYYCQIPTRTGAVVHAFHLHVASPQAVILGGQVSHVDILTPSLTLVCIVDNTPDPPQVIFWYHNGTLLKDGKYPETSDASGSGLISSHLTLTPSRTMSMLTLQHIQHIHSGNYTCRAPNAEPDTTQLFVTQRHEQAAVHRSSSARQRAAVSSPIFLIAALIGHVLTVRRKFVDR